MEVDRTDGRTVRPYKFLLRGAARITIWDEDEEKAFAYAQEKFGQDLVSKIVNEES